MVLDGGTTVDDGRSTVDGKNKKTRKNSKGLNRTDNSDKASLPDP